MARRSLIEYLAEYRRHGRDVAYSERQGYRTVRTSYCEVIELAAQFARELEGCGIAPGDRVLLWGRNSAEWVAAFFGCILRGAVAVPMDRGATADFVARVAQQVDAKLFVVDREHIGAVRHEKIAAIGDEQIGGTSSNLALAPVLELDSIRDTLSRHSRAGYSSSVVDRAVDRSAIAQIIFTSGTTSEPKGVVISHGNILANLEPLEAAIQPYLKWERLFHPLRLLDLVPLSHVFGQFLGMWVPPLLGATVLFQDSLNPAEIMATIARERVSVLIAVPRVLTAMQNKIERDLQAEGRLETFCSDFEAAANQRFVGHMWRFRRIHRRFGWKFWAVISGGAALASETELFWDRTGFAAIQGYGLTETTSMITVNHPFRLGRGSIGRVLEGREVKLDPSGEILVRGANVAAGYWQNHEIRPLGSVVGGAADSALDSAETDRAVSAVDGAREGALDSSGWFHTGDLGALDAAGNLYFKGRKKSVIVTAAGMNIYPADLEAALRREPEVKDCVVVPLAREGNAEACAVLLLRDESGGDSARRARAIIDRANASLAEYQRMQHWFVWPEPDFPRTSTGKPALKEILAAAEAHAGVTGSGSRAVPTDSGGIGELVRKITSGEITSAHSHGGIHDGADLETDLNLSSLDRVELLSAIEDRYQIDLNETRFSAAKTFGDVDNLVRESSASRSEFVFPRWAQRWPVTWIRALVYYLLTLPVTHLLAHPRVFGRENLRRVRGPVLVVCNHVIYLDVGFVLAALPPRLRHRLAVAMGGERLAEMRRPPREWFFLRRWLHRTNYFLVVALFNVFPLPKRSGFRESFRFAGELADRGWSVLVFPEGELTHDGKVQPFRAGVGLLASNLKLPVVPMRIDGAYEVREGRSVFNRPGRVRVFIGEPVEFSAASDPQQIARDLEERVDALGRHS